MRKTRYIAMGRRGEARGRREWIKILQRSHDSLMYSMLYALLYGWKHLHKTVEPEETYEERYERERDLYMERGT